MSRPFFLPNMYQSVANGLPGRAARSQVAYAGGQNQNVPQPWQDQAQDLHQTYRTTEGGGSWGGYNVPGAYDPVGSMTNTLNTGVNAMPGDVADSQMLNLSGGLGRVSGSMMREARRMAPRTRGPYGPGMDPRAFGTSNGTLGLGATVYANVRDLQGMRGLGAVDAAWYENPLYLGLGVVAIIGTTWYLTRKKKR